MREPELLLPRVPVLGSSGGEASGQCDECVLLLGSDAAAVGYYPQHIFGF